MMKYFQYCLVVVFLFLSFVNLRAQQNSSIRINSVTGDTNRLSRMIFRYPGFALGLITFTNNHIVTAMLNYNRLTGQMLFINGENDTLEIAQPELIQWLIIEKDTFRYFDKGYQRLITHYADGINLFENERIKYTGKEKKGAYGGYSQTSSANAINKISSENDIREIGVDINSLYAATVRYYISSHAGHFFTASKKNFEKCYSNKKDLLKTYLQQNKVNYNNAADLEALMRWLRNLSG